MLLNIINIWSKGIFLIWHLVSKDSILNKTQLNTQFKTKVSKAAGVDSLSGRFLKDGAKFLAKPNSDLYNHSVTSENFPGLCKVAKLKPLYEKGSLTQPCNYKPMPLLPLIFKVIEKVIQDQASTFLNLKTLL